ncbi:adenosine deaminase [Pelolinea submarina]|uniref:adenosine deaminase n=2 Tax=Pelolinea submarina TaxID=913107 RepID=A0A347ZSE6_9CHLR|nr:adenosine deaminase [Pelolinea submarina]REG11208.1 adenosine deaminase [Pelolinea submarina]BBB48227.1 adenosine deaminase [Pelolinea submarina]
MNMIHTNYPLVELHRHMDGSVRLETILDIGLKHNLPLPADTLEGLRPYVQVTEAKPSILDFFEKFEWLTAVMLDEESCRRIAYENVEDAKNEGLDYIELRFSPWFMAEKNHLNPEGVVAAVVDGVQAGIRDFGLPVNLIGIISRTYGPEVGMQELDALLTQKEAIIALDLAGDEIHYPGELFIEHFRKARDAGWHSCPHAGEAAGPESIWQAINELGAERIGHGVAAAQDVVLMDYLAEHGIGVETSLTSNVQTSAVPSYADHPIKHFLQAGIRDTINTDDPGISAVTISHEYNQAAVKAGLSEEEIFQAQKNALEVAFLSQSEKEELVQKKAAADS